MIQHQVEMAIRPPRPLLRVMMEALVHQTAVVQVLRLDAAAGAVQVLQVQTVPITLAVMVGMVEHRL